MKIACVGYRDWALQIYDALVLQTNHHFLIFKSKSHYDETILRHFNPDLILFYGWSWIVPSDLLNDFLCLMLHPSPLPRYRGGSPLQHQIIRGETEGAVTLFLMTDGLDEGPIVAQKSLSLVGELDEIFERITSIGIELTVKLLREGLHPVPQNHDEATCFKRRTPDESEITVDELREQPSTYLYNKIRMLQDPYPSAFIRTQDGKKLVILQSRIEDA